MLVEIVDNRDTPLGVMEEKQVHALKLPHRRILVLVYDKKNRFYLLRDGKKSSFSPWRLPVCSHIRAGCAREEVALSLLKANLAIRPRKLRPIFPPYYVEELCEFIFVYGALIPPYDSPITPSHMEKVALSHEEMEFLITEYPQLICRYVLMCWREGAFVRLLK